jgi:hypothetical protein
MNHRRTCLYQSALYPLRSLRVSTPPLAAMVRLGMIAGASPDWLKQHTCTYIGCSRQLDADVGYCSEDHAELDRGFVGPGVGGSRSPNERAMIRDALAKWDALTKSIACEICADTGECLGWTDHVCPHSGVDRCHGCPECPECEGDMGEKDTTQ